MKTIPLTQDLGGFINEEDAYETYMKAVEETEKVSLPFYNSEEELRKVIRECKERR